MSDKQVEASMEYTIVADGTLADLADKVNRLLVDGWKPQGGIAACVVSAYPRFQYVQALVREPSATEDKADSWSFDAAIFEARVKQIVETAL